MATCHHPIHLGEEGSEPHPTSSHPIFMLFSAHQAQSQGSLLAEAQTRWTMWPQSTFFMALPHVGPIVGWLFAQQHMPTWYETLKKPPWWPPNKLFLIVWTVIYSTMGYASYLVWKDLGGGFGRPLALPLGLYATQLVLNWIILLLFFGAHNLGLALCYLLLLYGLVLGMALSWHSINGLAVLLLVPYLAWLTVTTSLAYRLWMDNSSSESQLSSQSQLQAMGEKID